jgi:hypothetical protein
MKDYYHIINFKVHVYILHVWKTNTGEGESSRTQEWAKRRQGGGMLLPLVWVCERGVRGFLWAGRDARLPLWSRSLDPTRVTHAWSSNPEGGQSELPIALTTLNMLLWVMPQVVYVYVITPRPPCYPWQLSRVSRLAPPINTCLFERTLSWLMRTWEGVLGRSPILKSLQVKHA